MPKFQIGQQVRHRTNGKLGLVDLIIHSPSGDMYNVPAISALAIFEHMLEAVVVLQRQDEFLRSLLVHELPPVVREAIEHRLEHLKPVAYENDDLSRGFSGCGIHHICGDEASIKRVNELVFKEQFEQLYRDLYRDHLTLQRKLAAVEEALK